LSNILPYLQKLVSADKAVIVALVVQAAVSLTAGLGLHLSGSAVGTVSAIVAAGLSYFVHVHFAAKLALAKAEHAKP
jgi:hypothetical protein